MDEKDVLEKINQYISKAKKLMNKANYENADKSLAKALKISMKLNYKLGMAQCFAHLGQLKLSVSSFDASLVYYARALEIYEDIDDKEASASTYNNIGDVYTKQGNLNKALSSYKKSRKISLDTNSREILCYALIGCGSTSFKQKDLREALCFYFEALPIATEVAQKNAQYNILSSIGAIYVELKEFNRALDFFTDALKIGMESNSDYDIAYMNFRLAETYYLIDNCEKAVDFDNKALKIATKIANKPLQSYCFILLSNIYEKSGDYKGALKFFKDYSRIREDVLIEDKQSKIAEMKAKFELYKKEKESEIFKLKNEKLKKANKKLKVAYKNAEYIANIDFLTRIQNRRSIIKYINEKYINEKIPFSIILTDIDDFKIVNDIYGHDAGDYVLQETVRRLQQYLGDKGKMARWGGEEFLVMLPDTDLDQGIAIAERLRAVVSSSSYLYNNQNINITMTFGVYEYNEGDTFNDIIKKADVALYTGKSRGKNCVV